MKVGTRNCFSDFAAALKNAHAAVYDKYVFKEKLSVILDAFVEASYLNLVNAVKAKLIMEGKIVNPQGIKLPRDFLRDHEITMKEILVIISRELNMLDQKYEYALWSMKRIRKTEKL